MDEWSPTGTDHGYTEELKSSGGYYWYAKILSRFSGSVIIAVILLSGACAAVVFSLHDIPAFEDPTDGFEARYTDISARLAAWNSFYQTDALTRQPTHRMADPTLRRRRQASNMGSTVMPSAQQPSTLPSQTTLATTTTTESRTQPNTICRYPQPLGNYAKLVFGSSSDINDLLNKESVKAMCQAEDDLIRSHPKFNQACNNESCLSVTCPSSWSLGSYVALFNNKTSCYDINTTDVSNTRTLLHRCAPYYLQQWFNDTCSEDPAQCEVNPPVECVSEPRGSTFENVAFGGTPIGGVFTIFHYLTSADFAIEISKNPNAELKYASQIIPVEMDMYQRHDELIAMYLDRFHKKTYQNERVTLKALDFQIKFDLFEVFLFRDILFIAVGLLLVFLLLWVYTSSLLITLAACLNFALSLLLSYFCYFVIFRQTFFPFVNIASAVLVIGVGADDTFVYVDLWRISLRKHRSADLCVKVQNTLHHATLTMFVTSLSTAGSLYASIISNITAMKCFALFAGTAILMNFLLTLTLLPAVIILQYRLIIWYKTGKDDDEDEESYRSRCNRLVVKCLVPLKNVFDKHLPALVIKLRFVWLIVLFALGIAGTVVVFLFPGLRLPSSSEFLILREDNYLEQWDLVYKDMFAFSRDSRERMSAFIFIGIVPMDTANGWDPNERGTFSLDSSFAFSTQLHQEWMMQFCKDLREQTFYRDILYGTSCFIESLVQYMDRPCNVSQSIDRSPCCDVSVFPYDAAVFDTCLRACAVEGDCSDGVRFSTDDDRFTAIYIPFQSSTFVTYDYTLMQQYWSDLNGWVETEMASAPDSLKNGWVISYGGDQLFFIDLQDNLASGTPFALAITLAIVLIILLCTILNVILALYAILSVGFAVFVTIGSLVLLGWELNIFESVILTLSVGLCVDFTLHYGVAYKLAPYSDRHRRTKYSIQTMSAAISIAALSTFLAGVPMIAASINAYIQLGTFLILVMSISWVYSTLFFQALCRVLGPQDILGNVTDCCRRIFCHNHDNPNGDLQTERDLAKPSQSNASNQIPLSNPGFGIQNENLGEIRGDNQRKEASNL